jgi:SulP family sulfate permease
VLDRIGDTHKALIVDFSAVPFVDSTAAHTIEGLARNAAKHGVKLYITGTSPEVRHALTVHGVAPASVHYKSTIERALHEARGA